MTGVVQSASKSTGNKIGEFVANLLTGGQPFREGLREKGMEKGEQLREQGMQKEAGIREHEEQTHDALSMAQQQSSMGMAPTPEIEKSLVQMGVAPSMISMMHQQAQAAQQRIANMDAEFTNGAFGDPNDPNTKSSYMFVRAAMTNPQVAPFMQEMLKIQGKKAEQMFGEALKEHGMGVNQALIGNREMAVEGARQNNRVALQGMKNKEAEKLVGMRNKGKKGAKAAAPKQPVNQGIENKSQQVMGELNSGKASSGPDKGEPLDYDAQGGDLSQIQSLNSQRYSNPNFTEADALTRSVFASRAPGGKSVAGEGVQGFVANAAKIGEVDAKSAATFNRNFGSYLKSGKPDAWRTALQALPVRVRRTIITQLAMAKAAIDQRREVEAANRAQSEGDDGVMGGAMNMVTSGGDGGEPADSE